MPLLKPLDTISRLLRTRKARNAGHDSGQTQWVVAADDVRASFHENGIALLNLATGKVFLSNETGSRIWRGLTAGLTPQAIGEEMSREFGVAVDVVNRHTAAFLNELIRRGLVTRKAVN